MRRNLPATGEPRTACRIFGWTVLGLAVALTMSAARPAGQQPRTVWDGVYSAAQATRGQAEFNGYCSTCHSSGEAPALTGEAFVEGWDGSTVAGFFTAMKTRMPLGAPGSLADTVYLDIVAYLLQANGYPSGQDDLTAADGHLEGIQMVGSGGEPTSGTIVEIVGCLGQAGGAGWVLNRATKPVRTRNPDGSSASELAAAQAKPAGMQTFTLLGAAPPAAHAGQRLLVKGILVKAAGGDRLTVASMQTVGPAASCAP